MCSAGQGEEGLSVPPDEKPFSQLLDVMKEAAGALRDAHVPFMLGGGLAVWARGGPSSDHDVDFLLRPEDAERALSVLEKAGMQPDRPPEGWLFKAWKDDAYLDLIFETAAGPIDDDMFERADHLEVHAVKMDVASVEDILVSKLHAINEQRLDYGPVVEIARAVREQIDWDAVERRTQDSPYARAYFALLRELQII